MFVRSVQTSPSSRLVFSLVRDSPHLDTHAQRYVRPQLIAGMRCAFLLRFWHAGRIWSGHGRTPSAGTIVNRVFWAIFTASLVAYLVFAAHESPVVGEAGSYYATPSAGQSWALFGFALLASTAWLAICTSSRFQLEGCVARCGTCDGGAGSRDNNSAIQISAAVAFNWSTAASTSVFVAETLRAEVCSMWERASNRYGECTFENTGFHHVEIGRLCISSAVRAGSTGSATHHRRRKTPGRWLALRLHSVAGQ